MPQPDMVFQIDGKMPIPPKGSGNKSPYPWAELKVGASFFVPGGVQSTLVSNAIQWAQRNCEKAKFTTRNRIEAGVKGVRVWRTA